jgi:putative phosphoribosyl transferase
MNNSGLRLEVEVPADRARLPGTLTVPSGPIGIVLFAHGSGSSRSSPRNMAVAGALHQSGLATLLFDLLGPEEAQDRSNVFDIELLAGRLGTGVSWARHQRNLRGLPVGLFGASTGAAAALVAAAANHAIGAVVSRGGRPDLAGGALDDVVSPTLLIVGSADHGVIELNEHALARLRCAKRLEIVPGATHLFEEPGALEQVASLASGWFVEHLSHAPIIPAR